MSKPSTASTSKTPTPLSTKSAWSKGPPQTSASPRSQSPAPSTPAPTHSRRPSTLGQSIPIKDGVRVPSNVGATKTASGSTVSFGSIGDASTSTPETASPAATPANTVKSSEGVKSFGTVPATASQMNGKSSAPSPMKPSPSIAPSTSTSSASKSTPTPPSTSTPPPKIKMDVKSLFRKAPSSTPSSHPPSDSPSPAGDSSSTPAPPSAAALPPSNPSQIGSHPYAPYGAPNGMRPPQQNVPPNTGPGPGPPRSPFLRQMNGNGARPTNGTNVPPGQPHVPPAMGSPRLGPPPHGQPPNMQPGMPPPVQWPNYYYMHDPNYMYQWGYMPPPQHMQPHPPPPGTPHSAIPHSPRNPPPQLQGTPSTPTPVHAQPVPHTPHPHPPPPLSHSSSASISTVSSPPPTPSSASMPSSARMNSNASPFVPNRSSKITFKNPLDGSEVNLDALRSKQSHHPSPSVTSPPPSGLGSASPRRTPIKIESPEDKKKREEKEKEEARAKAEKERSEKEAVVKKKEAEEKAKKEAEEKARKEKQDAERKAKEKEEAERKAKQEEEQRKRKAKEEAERKTKEEEEKKLKEEKEAAERKVKEEEEKQRKEKEEAERKKHEEEKERIAKEEQEAAAKKAAAEKEAKTEDTLEEGEIAESKEESRDVPAELNDKESKAEDKKPLRIDTESHRRRPGPLDLSHTKNVPAPLPSALATARIIDDLGRVPYPEGVKSPSVELNANAKDGKFRYDRDFLLQFMSICKEKPDMLPPLDAIGLEPADQSSFSMGRGGSGPGMRRQASGAAGKGVGLGFPGSGFGKAGQPNPFMGGMGNFTTPPKTSEERFQLANGRPISVSSSMQFTPNRPGQLTRSASHGGPGVDSRRTRSKRGVPRDERSKMAAQQAQASNMGPGGIPLEPVAPLQATANRWDRRALASDPDSPEIVDRKVKALLNKLTMEKFDTISDQIIAWANKSESEKDGRTLIQVIRLVFEKATDEATWSEMYARLCRKMMEQISPKVQDDGIKNTEGKPIAGGQLFRKYLLNRCQEDFERGWITKEATAVAAATKALEDQAAKAANEKKADGENEEVALYSEEYYAAQKAKRQGLGLIKFIGELFKLQMLTERIMHECVKKLLGNVENPEEEEIESLCKLLTTVGQILDTNKARAHMDVYFSRMKELTKSGNVSSRMQFMLQDVIELRERKWITRNTVAAPTTLAKVHENAAKEKEKAEKESYQRQMTMSRGGSRRGADRSENQQVNADGWAVAGGNTPRAPSKAGDLSNFGKISKGGPMTFGPSSVFAGGKKDNKRESISRTNSSANMFQMLVEGGAEPPAPTTKGSRPPSRKASVDLGSSGVPEVAPQRRKIVLAPRTKPLEQDATTSRPNSDSESDEEVTDEPEQEMSEADAKKKIEEDTKEFFGVRSLDEAEVYFSKLPSVHHHRLVDKLVSLAIESKESDAKLVAEFFERAVSKKLCSSTALEEGFLGIAEFLDDIAIDAPKAPNLLAIMMKGASFDEEQRTRIASKSEENGSKLLNLLS